MPHFAEEYTPEELAKVNAEFGELLRSLQPKLKGNDKENITKAFDLAVEAHKNQRRLSGEPYIFHPIEVARICHEEIGLGPTAVVCALMHDVVEDTPIQLAEIQENFDGKVGLIVDGLTKLDGLYNAEGNQNAENLKKVLSTLIQDVRVILIKMADRLHNLRTIGPMPQHKQLKIATETMFIYAPLAHRLGLYQVKTEFEDICMRITDKEQYEAIESQLQNSEEERKKYLHKFIDPLEDAINELDVKYRILARPKAISSIWNKIKNKNVEIEEIYDLFAVRIIIDVPRQREKSVCWQIYSIITDHYKSIPERLKDWVTSPKGNGYESLHTTVIGPGGKFVEVQIRSERMDDIAERGFAAHWKYKGLKSDDSVYDKWLDNIRTLLENQNSDAIEFLADFKTNLFKEEVYVFTPNGDMRILPEGATALDFAFEIHSDVGARATSIKVNNKLVPMGYRLQNGDQVSVTTSKNQNPSESWLRLVITGKARSKIRSALNEKKKIQAELGKEKLQRKLKALKIDFETSCDKIVNHFNLKTRQELYLAIDDSTIRGTDITRFFHADGHDTLKPEEYKELAPKKSEDLSGVNGKDLMITINDEPGNLYKYELSSCCNPVPGDDIFAFTTVNSGMKIHRLNCSNASSLFTNYGYRIFKAAWNSAPAKDFVVELLIRGIDSGPGVIQTLTNELSNNQNINIKSFNIEGEEGVYEGRVKISVKDKNQLNEVMNSLKKLENISTVDRISS